MEITKSNKTGRPRSFDRAHALEQAMHAFWRHGYETTSVNELTAIMGITAPSLYAAFGDKKSLFLEAVQLYIGDIAVIRTALEAAPTAREAVNAMLVGSVERFTGKSTPPGCLLASATASGSATSLDVQAAIVGVRKKIAHLLQRRIERDIALGILDKNTNAASLANFVICVIQGMSVLARDGQGRAQLLALVTQAMVGFQEAP